MRESNPVNTALLSYGMSGEVFHGPLLRHNHTFHVSAIVQRSKGHAARDFPEATIYTRVDDVFADAAVELVIVNTPNHTHFEFVSRALNAGKHVVVEKPFTVTSAEADALIALAKEKQRVLTVFQNRRWDGDFLTLQQVIAEKRVGEIAEFEAHYDRFRNYVEPNTWKETAAPGTGILYNLGSHMLDQVLVLFGMPDTIDARIGIRRPGGAVDDYYDIRMQYAKFLVIVKSSYLVKEEGPRYILHGVNGSFVKYGIDPQEQALKEKKIPGSPGWGEERDEYFGKLNCEGGRPFVGQIKTVAGDYPAFYRNVYDAIRHSAALAVKPEQSRDVIRLIEYAEESNRTGKAIRPQA